MKKSKRYAEVVTKVDKKKAYSVEEAVKLLKKLQMLNLTRQ